MSDSILVSAADLAEALQIERTVANRHDELHAAQNQLERFVAHMRVVYNVPDDWTLTNWLNGFEAGAQDNGE